MLCRSSNFNLELNLDNFSLFGSVFSFSFYIPTVFPDGNNQKNKSKNKAFLQLLPGFFLWHLFEDFSNVGEESIIVTSWHLVASYQMNSEIEESISIKTVTIRMSMSRH